MKNCEAIRRQLETVGAVGCDQVSLAGGTLATGRQFKGNQTTYQSEGELGEGVRGGEEEGAEGRGDRAEEEVAPRGDGRGDGGGEQADDDADGTEELCARDPAAVGKQLRGNQKAVVWHRGTGCASP